MTTKRMTGADYRKEYNELKKSQESLYEHSKSRLLELGKIHPEAIIGKVGGCDVLAKGINKQWVDWLEIEEVFDYIETIENWSAELQKVEQLKIKE